MFRLFDFNIMATLPATVDYDSYEEAEQECLNKLIEIVKDK